MKAITDKDVRQQWTCDGAHDARCQVCGVMYYRVAFPGLAVHHIIHGCHGRSDEPCNYLLVCGVCHGQIHDGQFHDDRTGERLPDLSLGHVLWVKAETTEWLPDRLSALYGRRLPDLTPLPAYYLNERIRNGT